MSVVIEKLGKIAQQDIVKIKLTNKEDVSISLLNLGATWQEFLVPDGENSHKNIILGFDDPRDYLANGLCAGQTVGRVAGRIRDGHLPLPDGDYHIPINEGSNTLHGGDKGLHKQVWDYRTENYDDRVTAVFLYHAGEAQDGFPADYDIEAKFTLTNDNRVMISYQALNVTGDTVFNPTNHVYFNLGKDQHLHNHQLMIDSSSYLETRDDLIPTGNLIEVSGTNYDFREAANLGERIDQNGGFDDSFIVTPSLKKAQLILKNSETGEKIELFSDRNAIVAYTLGGAPEGIYPARDKGKELQEFEAIALEAQYPPDAVHHSHLGNILLRKGDSKKYRIEFQYSKP